MYKWNTTLTSINEYKSTKNLCCVYVFLFDNDYYYIGSTRDFHTRFKRHKVELKNKKHDNKFMQRLVDSNHTIRDVRILECELNVRLSLEDLFLTKCIRDKKCCNINDSAFMPPHYPKVLYQYTLDGNYLQSWCSLVEAAQYYKTSTGGLSEACTGKYQSSNGYRWSYEKLDSLPPMKYKDKYNGIYDTVICQYTLDGQFVTSYHNGRIASQAVSSKKSCTRLLKCLEDFTLTLHGFRWRKFNKLEEIPKSIPIEISTLHKKVLQISRTGELIKIWKSSTEAARHIKGCKTWRIHRVCSGARKHYKNFKWAYG